MCVRRVNKIIRLLQTENVPMKKTLAGKVDEC
jgi:hypothetical protein